MEAILSAHPKCSRMFSILRYGKCPALAAMKNLSGSNLKEVANALHIPHPEQHLKLMQANYDSNASLAELVYLEEAYQLAQSGESDQFNQMTDLQLRVVAYGKDIMPLEELYNRTTVRLRLVLRAKLSHRPAIKSEESDGPGSSDFSTSDNNDDDEEDKTILTKNNGVVMRF
ncbi:hypothetical protein EJ07DRAFT_158271 [Lizonia empirigonia]|nr:hypothetical protein EJ07DRAFT_158271 [Lizonia empirigonia]